MSDLYLVRHGQASFGTPDYDRLSPLGREQSELLAAHFAALGRRIDAFYSGPLRRQRDTARLLARALPPQAGVLPEPVVLEGLAEYDADVLIEGYLRGEGGAHDAAARLAAARSLDRAGYQRLLEAMGNAWVGGALAGWGEPWPAFRERVAAAIDEIRRREGRGRTIVAAVSAGVIAAALRELLALPDREALALSWVVHNSAVTLLRYDERRMSLATFNTVAHLERTARPELLTYR